MNMWHCNLAASMAGKSMGKFKLGAVLARGKQVVSVGVNNDRTHPRMSRFNPDRSYTPTLHAEVDACMGVPDDALLGTDLYVVRITKTGRWAIAKPCEICRKFLHDAGIRRVFYSNREGEMEVL